MGSVISRLQERIVSASLSTIKPKNAKLLIFLALLIAINFQIFFANDIFYALQVYFSEMFGFSSMQLSILSSSYSVPNFILPFLMGILVDRLGCTRCFTFSMIFVICGSVLLALSTLLTNPTLVFVGVLMSRICLAVGGQSIFTSHDVLHVKIFGISFVSVSISLGIMAGKFGSTAAFMFMPGLTEAIGLPPTLFVSVLIIAPLGALGFAVLALHARDRRKKKRLGSKSTVEVTQGLMSGWACPVDISAYPSDDEGDEPYALLHSFPQTPAEYIKDEIGQTYPTLQVDPPSAGAIVTETMASRQEGPEPTQVPVPAYPGQSPLAVSADNVHRVASTMSLVDEYSRSSPAPEDSIPFAPIDGDPMSPLVDQLGGGQPIPPIVVQDIPVQTPATVSAIPGAIPEPTLTPVDSERESSDGDDDGPETAQLMYTDSILTAAIEELGGDSAEQVRISLNSAAHDTIATSYSFWLLVAAVALSYCNIFAFPPIATQIIIAKDPTQTVASAGRSVSMFYLALSIAPIFPPIVNRIGGRPLIIAAAATINVGVLILMMVTPIPPALLLIFTGLCFAIVGIAGYAAIPLTVRRAQHGIAFGILCSCMNVGVGLTLFLGVNITSISWRLGITFFIAIDVAVIAMCSALYVADRLTGSRLTAPARRTK